MKNSTICILNWVEERIPNVKKILSHIPGGIKVILSTKFLEQYEVYSDRIEIIPILDNVAACKNVFLKTAIMSQKEFCYILEDNFYFSSLKDLELYQYPMKMFDIPLATYGGYKTRGRNMVYNLVNPAVTFQFKGVKLVFNRTVNTSLTVHYLLSKDYPSYNEDLKVAELEYLSLQLKDKGLFPFFGLYLDIPNAFNYFKETDNLVFRKKTKDCFDSDKETLKRQIIPDTSLDILITYLTSKAKNKGLM